MSTPVFHLPAMPAETIEYLAPEPGKVIADFTIGLGGHSELLLQSGATVIGIDRDAASLELARQRLAPFSQNLTLLHARMSQAEEVIREAGFENLHGVLIDCGISMWQMRGNRGFSINDESLEMKMDPTDPESISGEHIVNVYLQNQLVRVFDIVGRPREARAVARAIVTARSRSGPITSSQKLSQIIAAAIGPGAHTIEAARYQSAIRATVNEELPELSSALAKASSLLLPKGRLVVLTFQSHEMRLVRQTFRQMANPCSCPARLPCVCGLKPRIKILTPNPLSPSAEEVATNPAIRSVRLHAAEMLEQSGI